MLQENPDSLSQVLKMQLSAPQKKYYVFALAKSRTEQPTYQILISLRQLIDVDKNWMQVAKRLTEQDSKAYEMVAQMFINDFPMYRILINMSFQLHQNQVVQKILQSILQRMNIHLNADVSVNLVFETLQIFLLNGADSNIQLFVPFFNNQPSQYLNKYLTSDPSVINCIIILIQKYILLQKKNLLKPSFKNMYPEFQTLIKNTFNLCISTQPTNQTLELLCIMSEKYDMYDLYTQNMSLFLNMCENILSQFNKKMNSDFEKDPEEAINYQYDIIEGQKSNTIQTQASKLFQMITKNIDGMLTFVLERIFSMLKQFFIHNSIQPNKLIIEVLYLQLVIISKQLKKRSDLLQQLTQFLGDYSSHIFVIRPKSIVLNSRIVKIIEHFIHNLPSNQFQNTISFLFRCVEEPLDGFVMSVYQTLQSLVNDKDLYQMLNPCIITLSSRILSSIQKASSERHFVLLSDCLKHFDDLSQRHCIKFLQSFTSRIHRQVKQCHLINQNINQKIVQMYRSIKIIIKKPYLLDDLYDQIQPILKDHAAYLQNPNQIGFQDKILDICAIVIEKGKEITPFVLGCLKSVMGVYNKNKDLDYFFEIFYSLCKYATNSMLQNLQSIQFIVNLVLKFLKQQANENMMHTGVYGRACVILQIVIQYFEPLFIEGQLREKVVNQLLIILKQMKIMPTTQFINIILCLYFVSPFAFKLPKQYLDLSDFYSNKLKSLYLSARIKYQFSQDSLFDLLQYLQRYIEHYILKPNSSNQNQITDQQKYIEALSLPFRQINDVKIIQQLIKDLKHKKKIDIIQLTQQQRNTLNTIIKLDWCDRQLRKVHKFINCQ